MCELCDLEATLLEGLEASLHLHDLPEGNLCTDNTQTLQLPCDVLGDSLRGHLRLSCCLSETHIASVRCEDAPKPSSFVLDGHPTIVLGRCDHDFKGVPRLEDPPILVLVNVVELFTPTHILPPANVTLEVLSLRLRQRAHPLHHRSLRGAASAGRSRASTLLLLLSRCLEAPN